MGRKSIACAFVGVLAFAAAAREPAPSTGKVLIRFRHPTMICAGICPNYQIEIFANGDVVRGNPPPEASHLYHNREIRFHVTRSHLRNFRAQLDVLRPSGDLAVDTACERGRLADGSLDPLDASRPDDILVRWIDPGRNDQLTACASYGGALRGKIENALRTLGVNPNSGAPARH